MSIVNEVIKDVKLRESKVGAFYVIKGEVWSDATPVRDGVAGSTARFVDGKLGHWDLWYGVVAPLLNFSDEYEYDDFPRGRVIFDKSKGKYKIIADQKILNDPSILKKVISEFNLKANSYFTETDEHYQSLFSIWRSSDF
ncbi:MAG: hypothetical protein J1F64_00410 [Oscillospiraceae bacterium]|nr:hypothetical protein [Oscillospiraceae bacterium]